jgi:hemerythrin-like domain-containing protein
MEAPDHEDSVAEDNGWGRLAALGNQLIDTHVRLLDALDDLRSGAPPSRELRDHCLAFCAAITRHHTEEDTSVFPMLAARHPELREVLEGLERDHTLVAGMLRRVARLAEDLDADGARAELDGAAALLESHFAWEEKRLVTALNALGPDELRPQW